jgi:DNA polymerase-3 subunit alpha
MNSENVNKPGKTILVKLVSNTVDQQNTFNKLPGLVSCAETKTYNSYFLTFDTIENATKAYATLSEDSKKYNINLRYGLRITLTDDIKDKTDDSRQKNCKFVIFFKNQDGYKNLINIFTTAAKDGFYYEPRIDYKTLKSLWDEKNLLLAIPFYDSFIFNNTLKGSVCVPDIEFTKPILFIENNNLPFESIVKAKVLNFSKTNNLKTIETKSIYYKNKKDFKAYLTFRCINNRSTLNKPELQHMTSNRFSFESLLK